ncbi:MAG: DUF5655 domain-containing protein [Bryobacteraceae bacterium]
MAKSPGGMLSKILENLRLRTGKDLAQWSRVVKKQGPAGRKRRVEWLMKEHGIGRVAAGLIASEAEGKRTDYSDAAGLIEGIFSGPKSALRPLYEEIAAAAKALGADVETAPARTQVTFRRGLMFAWVKAPTSTRLDLGLALPGMNAGGRLLPIPGANDKDRVRLRVAISSRADIDAEVKSWLAAAYGCAAGCR